jgi:MFS family permease
MGSLINFEQTLGCFITGFALAKFGRKAILQFGSFTIGIACLLITIGFFIKETSKDASEYLVLTGLFAFMLFFGFSLGPVVWLYIPEIVQPNIVPYSTASNWIGASFVVILFPIISDGLFDGNPKVLFAVFTIWCFASVIFNHFFVVETKDKQ